MRTFRNIAILLLIASATLLFSCNKNKLPEGVLDEKTMVAVLTDMHTADAYFKVTTGSEYDTIIGEINYTYNQIFKQHGTTKEDFEKSMEYYSKNPKQYRAMYEKVVLKLNKK